MKNHNPSQFGARWKVRRKVDEQGVYFDAYLPSEDRIAGSYQTEDEAIVAVQNLNSHAHRSEREQFDTGRLPR